MIDLGTGDGRAVLARAAAEPGTMVLGIDADASGMAEAASRAAHAPRRGGLPNARFLVCAVEALPIELAGAADLVTIQFPWSSLLRGLVLGEARVIEPLASLLRPAGELRILLSVEERDAALGLEPLDAAAVDRVAAALARCRLSPTELRPASRADLEATRSTWARRLGVATGARAVWLLRFAAAAP